MKAAFFIKNLSFALLFLLFYAYAGALEIPISGSLQRDNKIANGIVYVDMQRVFESHPMTERSKREIKNFAQTRKNAIEVMVKQYEEAQRQLQEINLKIVEAQAADDEQQLSELSVKFAAAQKNLEDQRVKITDLSGRTKTELILMEEKNSLAVLKDIEIVLKDVSRRHDAEVVLDKQSVLCGSESCEDVTDEVIKKLEGR